MAEVVLTTSSPNELIFKDSEQEYSAQGRNGISKVKGLYAGINDIGEYVHLAPINTKGDITNCFIQIPFDELERIAALLQDINAWRKGQ
jgi:hypothetical protein